MRLHCSQAWGPDPIRLGHGPPGGWDFSSKGDKEFTLGGISLMSSLQVEGLSGIHHSQGGGSAGSWTNPPGVHPFWELQNLASSEDKDGKLSLEWFRTSLPG